MTVRGCSHGLIEANIVYHLKQWSRRHPLLRHVTSKIDEYRQTGVRLVWYVEPTFSTITVHRPDAAPISFNVHDELTAEPHLPGFRVAVADILE